MSVLSSKLGDMVLGLLRAGRHTDALKVFHERSADWWERNDKAAYLLLRKKLKGIEQLELKDTVLGHLREGRIQEADRIFKEQCAQWWDAAEYELDRTSFVRVLREAAQRNLKDQVTRHLNAGDFSEADRIFQEQCADWWDVSDYERARSAAEQAILRVRRKKDAKAKLLLCFSDDYLAADFIYQNEFADALSPEEYLALRHEFVRKWLRGGMPIPPDQFPDDEQIAAIAEVAGTIQVTARAGSGKTTTLIRRTYFLMRHCRVPPEQILILAFNRSAAADVRQKLLAILCPASEPTFTREMAAGEKSIRKPLDRQVAALDRAVRIHEVKMPNVMTFHALAYGLVNPEETLLIDSNGGGELGLSRVAQDVIDGHLRDGRWLPRIRSMMLDHFRHDWERIERGGYDLPDRGTLIAHRKSLPRETLRGEYVKSFGEKVIADFLLEHGIPYKYERNHRWDGFNYRPDFTLFREVGRNPTGVIIEYFGMRGQPEYDENSVRKRNYWSKKPNWDFLEFFPENIAGNGVDDFRGHLRDALIGLGFPCVPLTEDQLWDEVKGRAVDRFTKAMVSFIGRCRKLLLTPEALGELCETHNPATDAEEHFIPLACQFYKEYLDALVMSDSEDFDGVMQRAISAVRSGHTLVRRKQEVVCDLARIRFASVDEFQDFSELFYQLVQAVRDSGESTYCFCVGDDWQAINGFAGSDLKYFRDFTKYMGESTRLAITTNYRSSRAIVDAGNALMLGQGAPAHPRRGALGGTVLVAEMSDFDATLLEQRNHQGDDITPAVLRVAAKSIEAGRSVVVLCRKNSIPWYVNWNDAKKELASYESRLRSFLPDDKRNRISVSTAHKFKGLERDDVIVIDAVSRSYPLVHPDWVFSRILGVTIEQLVAEEQRLFYVALTRAKESVVLFTEKKGESPFLTELKSRIRTVQVAWGHYPPCDVTSQQLVVCVANRLRYRNEGRSEFGTYVMREALKLSGYKYKGDGVNVWEKAMASEGFDISVLQEELWVPDANGVDVVVRDGNNRVVGRWFVDDGKFSAVREQGAEVYREA